MGKKRFWPLPNQLALFGDTERVVVAEVVERSSETVNFALALPGRPLEYRGERLLTNRELARVFGVTYEAVKKAAQRRSGEFIDGMTGHPRPDYFDVPGKVYREWNLGGDNLSPPSWGSHRGSVRGWTFKGALVICAGFESPAAADARQLMAAYYEDGVKGYHGSVPSVATESEIIRIADGRIKTNWETEQRPQIQAMLDITARRILDGVAKRRDFSEETLAKWSRVIWKRGGRCPNCGKSIMSDPGSFCCRVEADHWFHRSQNGPDQGWYVCSECHGRFADASYRLTRQAAFNAWQLFLQDDDPPFLPCFTAEA